MTGSEFNNEYVVYDEAGEVVDVWCCEVCYQLATGLAPGKDKYDH